MGVVSRKALKVGVGVGVVSREALAVGVVSREALEVGVALFDELYKWV